MLNEVHVCTKTVRELLKQQDINKGCGSDVIPFFWRHRSGSPATLIAIIFNRSLNEEILPAMLKSTYVVLVHKKGSRSEIENYREISVLNPLAKMLELVVYNAIYQFIYQALRVLFLKRDHKL